MTLQEENKQLRTALRRARKGFEELADPYNELGVDHARKHSQDISDTLIQCFRAVQPPLVTEIQQAVEMFVDRVLRGETK